MRHVIPQSATWLLRGIFLLAFQTAVSKMITDLSFTSFNPGVLMHISPTRLWQFAKFCMSGFVAVATYFTIYYVLTKHIGIWYVASATFAGIFNTAINFLLHKLWTFGNTQWDKAGWQIFFYASMRASFLIANAICLFILVERIHFGPYVAQLILSILFSILSFLISSAIFNVRNIPA